MPRVAGEHLMTITLRMQTALANQQGSRPLCIAQVVRGRLRPNQKNTSLDSGEFSSFFVFHLID